MNFTVSEYNLNGVIYVDKLFTYNFIVRSIRGENGSIDIPSSRPEDEINVLFVIANNPKMQTNIYVNSTAVFLN